MSGYCSRTIVAVAGLVLGSTAFALPPDVENSSADTLIVEAEIPKSGSNLAFGFDALWVVRGGSIIRIDADGYSASSIHLEGGSGLVRDIAVGEGAVWVPDVGSRMIYKIDPTSNRVVQRIPAEMYGTAGSIGVGEGSIWVITGNDRVLTRFAARSGTVEGRIALPADGAGVSVAFGSTWVTGYWKGELYRIDPKRNAVVQTTRLERVPRPITAAYGSLWVLNWGSGTVQRIDPDSGLVKATIPASLPDSCSNLIAGGGYLWVSQSGTPLIQINASGDTILRKYRAAGWSRDIRYGAGSLWMSGASIKRMQPPD